MYVIAIVSHVEIDIKEMCRNSLFNVITLITAICDEGNYSFLQYTVYIFSFSSFSIISS